MTRLADDMVDPAAEPARVEAQWQVVREGVRRGSRRPWGLFAGMATVWLHGRLANLRGDLGAAATGRLMAARIQALLAAGFAVKLGVLVVGVFGLRQFSIGEVPTKFADLATFAVTFAAAALLCQVTTAAFMARSMRQPRTQPPTHSDAL